MALNDLLFSKDPDSMNRAFKALSEDPKIIGKIRQWLKFFTLSSVDAEEILQEGIISFYDTILEKKYKGASSAETFLLGICKNKIRTVLRKIKPNVEIDETFGEKEDMSTEIEAIEEQNEADDLQKAITDIVKTKLDPKCDERMRLHHEQGMSMTEVAKALGLANADQAKKAVYRCREKLRELLASNPIVKSRFPKLFKSF